MSSEVAKIKLAWEGDSNTSKEANTDAYIEIQFTYMHALGSEDSRCSASCTIDAS